MPKTPEFDLSQFRYEDPDDVLESMLARVEEMRAEGPIEFADRLKYRVLAVEMEWQMSEIPVNRENFAWLTILDYACRICERLGEPSLELDRIFELEIDSPKDIRMLVQSEFRDLPWDSIHLFEQDIFLLEEGDRPEVPIQQLRVRSDIFQLPQVQSYWMSLSKTEIKRLWQSNERGKDMAESLLATLRIWEQEQSQRLGMQIGVLADGQVRKMVKASKQ